MFERFTERARKVVVLAQDEARRLRHDYIGTEHLLMGLIREEEGVAAQALYACGATLDGVREQVEAIVGYGDEETGSRAPFTQSSKDVLELSLGESLRLGHNYIGTEHILLGLLAEGGGVSTTALSNLGIEPEKIRGEALRRMGGGTRFRSRANPSPLDWAREALQRSFGRYPRAGDRASFEKFTERARKVVVLAQEEARHFNHNYIGTEHILLGLIREDEGLASQALKELGVRLDEAREQVESIVGYGEEGTGAQAPFTPRTSKVLQLATLEARQLDRDYVSTEHVLLGLLRESEGVAARVLSNLSIDPDAVRREIIRRLSGGGDEYDSLDAVERRMEEDEAGWKLFRGKVKGIRAELNLPRPLTVSVDADYSYRVSPGFASGSTSVELGDVADLIRDELLESEARSLEAAAMILGERLLESFPAMLELGVSISGAPEPSDPHAPTFSVSTTFCR